jgi:glutaredoxin 3
MAKVHIYCTPFCPYCMWAKRMLKKKRIEFEEIRVDRDLKLRDEMERRSGRNTVPQIFVGEYHIGGYDDMAAMDRQGQLDSLLGLKSSC